MVRGAHDPADLEALVAKLKLDGVIAEQRNRPLRVVDGLDGLWLVEERDECTCGAGGTPGCLGGDLGIHEPGCGTVPLQRLEPNVVWTP